MNQQDNSNTKVGINIDSIKMLIDEDSRFLSLMLEQCIQEVESRPDYPKVESTVRSKFNEPNPTNYEDSQLSYKTLASNPDNLPLSMKELSAVSKLREIAVEPSVFNSFFVRELLVYYNLDKYSEVSTICRSVSRCYGEVCANEAIKLTGYFPEDSIALEDLVRSYLGNKLNGNKSQSPNVEKTKKNNLVFVLHVLLLKGDFHPKLRSEQRKGDEGEAPIRVRRIDEGDFRNFCFGFRTEIRGFDDLFGDSGMYLFTKNSGQSGRVILVSGGYGNGKTTFALQLAADIARQEGLAWFIPFEQSTSECELSMLNLGISKENEFELLTSLDALERGEQVNTYWGALFILKLTELGFEKSIDMADLVLGKGRSDRLRCLIIDPVNALENFSLGGSDSEALSRANLYDLLISIKMKGINIILVGENTTDENQVVLFKKLSDVVINLSREKITNELVYKSIEIEKSRHQFAVPGRHPFRILSDRGVRIYPVPSSVKRWQLPISERQAPKSADFGWPEFDKFLGSESFLEGDALAIIGPQGTLKSEIGLLFAFAKSSASSDSKQVSILFSSSLNDAVVSQKYSRFSEFSGLSDEKKSLKKRENIIIKRLPVGEIFTGEMFEILDEIFVEIQESGRSVSRVVFDNAEQWDISCPYLIDDQLFVRTFLDYFSNLGVTTLFLFDRHKNEILNRASISGRILDYSQVRIDHELVSVGSVKKVLMSVRKTRNSQNFSKTWELQSCLNGYRIRRSADLLELENGHVVDEIKINLMLHSEGDIGDAYNRSICAAIQPLFSQEIKYEKQDRNSSFRALSLSEFATAREVQVLQIDDSRIGEYVKNESTYLKYFSEEGDSFDFVDRSFCPSADFKNSVCAFPYFENLPLMVIDTKHRKFNEFRSKIEPSYSELSNWETLELVVGELQESNKMGCSKEDPYSVFFDFDCRKPENYLSTFLEVLLSSGYEAPVKETSFMDWIGSSEGSFSEGLMRFWNLCHRAHRSYRSRLNSMSEGAGKRVADSSVRMPLRDTKAIFYRVWFSVLVEEVDGIYWESLKDIKVNLAGQAGVRGTWYLAVPEYSVSDDVSLEIIKMLISNQEQRSRLDLGVGLPVNEMMYSAESGNGFSSRFFDIDNKRVSDYLKKSLRRSDFSDYRSLSPRLYSFLRMLLEGDFENAKAITAKSLVMELRGERSM